MKIVHVVPVLHGGGAQYFMYRLLQRLSPHYQSEVISLHSAGLIGEMVATLGIPVTALGMKRGSVDIPRILELRRAIKKANPDIVHTWMHHADLLGGVAARAAGIKGVIWSIRGDLEKKYTKPSTQLVGHVCALLSAYVPTHIMSCAHASRANHIKMGYPPQKITVISSGCDTAVFRPDGTARAQFRTEYGISNGVLAVGMMARFHEQKRQRDFLEIARNVLAQRPGVRFFMGGRDVDGSNATLTEWIAAAGLQSAVTLLGRRDDMQTVLNGLDVLVSPSIGEGLPLLIGEAMACGLPCVATSVGDTGYLIGDTGITAGTGDITAMAVGVERILAMEPAERRAFGERARMRIVENFELGTVTRRYEDFYDQVYKATHGQLLIHTPTPVAS